MRAILTYHSVDDSGSPISVDPDVFRDQLDWLASGTVSTVPLSRILDGGDEEDRIALTFDDGLASFGEVAAPLLRERGLPSTLFVVTDRAGGTNRFGNPQDAHVPEFDLLDRDALTELSASGVDLGAHTRTHPDLTRVADEEVEDEIEGSADALEAWTGRRPNAFAYPYGSFDGRALECARRAFDLACSARTGLLDGSSDRHALPRIDMYYFRRRGQLQSWGTPAFARRVGLIRLRRTARRTLEDVGLLR